MKKLFRNFRFLIEYFLILIPYSLMRISPHFTLCWAAAFAGRIMFMIPAVRKLVAANVRAAFPEIPENEVRRIARESLRNLVMNLLEFAWMTGAGKRIERWTCISDEIVKKLKSHVSNGERIIFVNPHLGSWEASAVIATHTCNIKMAAIAKVTRNPYLNNLLNKKCREIQGLRVIFSKGAMKETIKALNEGLTIGTLIDQNTRIRDGGVFVNFFGLPAPCSKAPATLWRYAKINNMPAVMLYGAVVRINGRLTAHCESLSRTLEEYACDREIIQELIDISEKYIRKFPEQYLWLYKRFQHIPEDVTPEQRKRYPFYSRVASRKFYDKRAKADNHSEE
jgi:KDO2-lipid IV(A) lauroyltransferase